MKINPYPNLMAPVSLFSTMLHYPLELQAFPFRNHPGARNSSICGQSQVQGIQWGDTKPFISPSAPLGRLPHEYYSGANDARQLFILRAREARCSQNHERSEQRHVLRRLTCWFDRKEPEWLVSGQKHKTHFLREPSQNISKLPAWIWP